MRLLTSRHHTFPDKIHLKYGTVGINYKIKTVSVLLVSNALFRLQTEQAGFVLKVVGVLQRELLKLLFRATLHAKKKPV